MTSAAVFRGAGLPHLQSRMLVLRPMVDPNGNIVSALRGVHSRQELRAALENLD